MGTDTMARYEGIVDGLSGNSEKALGCKQTIETI